MDRQGSHSADRVKNRPGSSARKPLARNFPQNGAERIASHTETTTTKPLSLSLSIVTHPLMICTGAAFAAFALAAAAANYLTNPKSVVVSSSAPIVRPIVSVPEAAIQPSTDARASNYSAQPNVSPVASASPTPSLQPFTTTTPETFTPSSAQQLHPATSLVQDPLVWSFGAIAIGCIAGCLMISHQLSGEKPGSAKSRSKSNPGLSRSKVFVPLPAEQLPTAAHAQTASPASGYGGTISAAALPATTVAPLYLPAYLPAAGQSPQLRKRQRPTQGNAARSAKPTLAAPASNITSPKVSVPQVTVLPQTAIHPLDWQDQGLANQLDIRQHRPLSSW